MTLPYPLLRIPATPWFLALEHLFYPVRILKDCQHVHIRTHMGGPVSIIMLCRHISPAYTDTEKDTDRQTPLLLFIKFALDRCKFLRISRAFRNFSLTHCWTERKCMWPEAFGRHLDVEFPPRDNGRCNTCRPHIHTCARAKRTFRSSLGRPSN